MGFLKSMFGGNKKESLCMPPEMKAIMEKICKAMEDEDYQKSMPHPMIRDHIINGFDVD